MLNGVDGLDHLSRVRVYPIYQVFKEDLGGYSGILSSMRQQAVAKKIRDVYRLGQLRGWKSTLQRITMRAPDPIEAP